MNYLEKLQNKINNKDGLEKVTHSRYIEGMTHRGKRRISYLMSLVTLLTEQGSVDGAKRETLLSVTKEWKLRRTINAHALVGSQQIKREIIINVGEGKFFNAKLPNKWNVYWA